MLEATNLVVRRGVDHGHRSVSGRSGVGERRPVRGSCSTVPSWSGCSLGTLLAGSREGRSAASITVVAMVARVPRGELTNSATASSASDDPDPGNNAASAPLDRQAPRLDLSVTKQMQTPIPPSGRKSPTPSLSRYGPSVAGAASVPKSLPQQFASISADTPTGSSGAAGPPAITCEIGDLAVDEEPRRGGRTMAVPGMISAAET